MDRLFPLPPSPAESRARARWARQAQLAFFGPDEPVKCPACSGVGKGCTCDITGAEAPPLFVA